MNLTIEPALVTLLTFIVISAIISYSCTRCFIHKIKAYESFADCTGPVIVAAILIFGAGWLCQHRLDTLEGLYAAELADSFQTIALISVLVMAALRAAHIIWNCHMYSRSSFSAVVRVPNHVWRQNSHTSDGSNTVRSSRAA